MLILSIETSSRSGSLALTRALTRGESGRFTVLELVPLAGGAYSSRLIPELSALLARHQLGLQDLEGIAVVAGPGSFTGLRVGLSTAKGLAEILRRPIAALSMLEVIAAEATGDGRVISGLDAGRKEFYAGEYDVLGHTPRRVNESLLSRDEFLALLAANPTAEVVSPDRTVNEAAAAHPRLTPIAWPDAGKVGGLGLRKFATGETTAIDTLDANYIRRSDAEIFSPVPR